MDQWYLYRSQQQYGPYSGQQLADMAAQGQIFQSDLFARVGSAEWLEYSQASPFWTMPVQAQLPKQRKKHGCLITLLVVVLVISGLVTWKVLTKKSDKLSLGARHQEISEAVGNSGGTIRIDDSSSTINGLVLNVPAGAYQDNQSFKISTRDIKSHRFGAGFIPVSPLITVENGHMFADKPMTLTLPVATLPDKFVMGFYFDEKTGELEGIPFVDLADDHITLMTSHFSDFVLAEASREDLEKIKADTGFRPGVDDWQFVNRGSWLAPGGHCAGQTISMVWYFTERYQARNERRLYGRFDNNSYGYGTIDFWQDDSLSYRFASVVQDKIDWDSKSRDWIQNNINTSAENTYCAFAFSMLMTGEPQYLSIRGDYTNPATGDVENVGHAIAVYRIDAGKLYVSDPNYPGSEQRLVRFDGTTFAEYNSGLNAEAIAETGEVGFNQMFYMAKTALVDYSTVAGLYEKVLDGTIGTDANQFPAYQYERLVRIDPATGEKTWEACAPELKLTTADTTTVHPSLAGKIVVRIKNPYANMVTQAFIGLNPTTAATSKQLAGATAICEYTLSLEKGVNHFGFLVEYQTAEGKNKYVDFRRLKVLYDQKTLLEFEKQPYQTIIDTKNKYEAMAEDVPANTHYLWDFGDGSDLLETKKPIAEHLYATAGDQEITLKLINNKDETVLAEATAAVTVLDLYGQWDLQYTIEYAGGIDYILNLIVKALANWITEIFGTEASQDINVSIEGTVIGCVMSVSPPVQEGGDITIELQQLTSSTDFVKPTDEIWQGKLAVDGDKIRISITAEGQPSGIVFEGTIDSAGLAGTYNAVIMSGSFTAVHR